MLAQDLAAAIGLDPSAMSNIENGKRSVKAHELTAIADALGVSVLAILDENSLLGRLPTAARQDDGERAQGSLLDRLRGFAELHELLAKGGIGSFARIPEDAPYVDRTQWRTSADQLAGWATRQLGPVEGPDHFNNLADRIETTFYVDVVVEDHSDGTTAGAAITDWTFPLLLVRADQRRPRGLFTLAHELGHLLAREDETFTVDDDLAARDPRERFANAFAAAYLMPADKVREEVDRNDIGPVAISNLMRTLGVSHQSLIYRLHNLGLIDFARRNELEQLGPRGLLAQLSDREQARETLANVTDERTALEHRRPLWLTYRATQGFKRGVISVAPVAELLGVDADELLDQLTATNSDAVRALDPNLVTEDDSARYAGRPA
jgi:Zn-dependent peptidase ImmA (M78 family)